MIVAAAIAWTGPATAQRVAPPPWQLDPFPSRYRAPPPDDMLLKGATILDGAGGRNDRGDVLIPGGKILSLIHISEPTRPY